MIVFPSSMSPKSNSAEAKAKTSAEALKLATTYPSNTLHHNPKEPMYSITNSKTHLDECNSC